MFLIEAVTEKLNLQRLFMNIAEMSFSEDYRFSFPTLYQNFLSYTKDKKSKK